MTGARAAGWALSLALSALAGPAPTQTLLSPAQAQARLWPGVALRPVAVTLTAAQCAAVARACGEPVRQPALDLRVGPQGQALLIDQVWGKHEPIIYALAAGPGPVVKGLEILDYREHYGQQVEREAWRQGFVGKGPTDALKVGQDLDALAGATISATHLAGGVRRLLATLKLLGLPKTAGAR